MTARRANATTMLPASSIPGDGLPVTVVGVMGAALAGQSVSPVRVTTRRLSPATAATTAEPEALIATRAAVTLRPMSVYGYVLSTNAPAGPFR